MDMTSLHINKNTFHNINEVITWWSYWFIEPICVWEWTWDLKIIKGSSRLSNWIDYTVCVALIVCKILWWYIMWLRGHDGYDGIVIKKKKDSHFNSYLPAHISKSYLFTIKIYPKYNHFLQLHWHHLVYHSFCGSNLLTLLPTTTHLFLLYIFPASAWVIILAFWSDKSILLLSLLQCLSIH